MLDLITPLILTYNEESNIGRTLEKLRWAKSVIVVDSFSTDKTLEILRDFPNVTVFQQAFDGFALQTNWGIEHVKTEWILSLDADYLLTDELIEEIKKLNLNEKNDGYFAVFKYCVEGKPLRSTLLPPREVLFKRDKCRYKQDGHAHKLVNFGPSGHLKGFIYHDDRKSFLRWWTAQKEYALHEAEKIGSMRFFDLSSQDKLRKMIFVAPGLVFFYCLFYRGLILDGWKGWIYSFQRFSAELLLSINLMRNFFK